MRIRNALIVAGLGLCSLSGVSPGQATCFTPISPLPAYKWLQPYTPPRATFESRVQSCQAPTPLTRIALDDWLCTKQGPIVRVSWWGWLRTPAQGKRPFYVAVYPDQNCQPALATQPLFRLCVVPDVVRLVSKDCQPLPGTAGTHPIYYMSAPIPIGAIQQFGTAANPQHLWLQISEADQESIQPGIEDFRWAGRRPIQVCPAVQFPPLTQPLIDPCDNQPDDLSFNLYSRSVVGHFTKPVGSIDLVLRGRLMALDGTLVEEVSTTVGDDGNYAFNFDAPDGPYMLEFGGSGMLHRRGLVQLQEGQEFHMSFFDVFFGDLNDDGTINTIDLVGLIGAFGQTGP